MNKNFELFRKHWIWPLLVTGISLLLTIYSAYLQHKSAQHEMGGSLMASFYQHNLHNRGARTIVVCMEDADVNLRGLYVTPTFDNPSEFSIKDFSLTFDVQCSNVSLVPSSFVETHSYGGDEWLYRYKDNLLAAHDDTKRIFTDFKVTGNIGYCFVETKASYDGATAAFEYNTDIWFLIVPKKQTQSYDDWKISCKKRIFEIISDKYYDVYYYSHGNIAEYQFDVALNNDNKVDVPNLSPQPLPAPKKETNPQETSHPSNPVKAKDTPATTGKVKTETNSVDVKPAIENQEVNIVKYSSSKNGKNLIISYELNKVPTKSSDYILYGNYTVPGKDAPYLFIGLIDISSTETKSCTYSRKTIDSLTYYLNELRLIKETVAEGTIKISHDAGRRVIKNVTDNKIVLIVYTSANSYRDVVLEKSEVFYDDKGNDYKIHVFDTGEKSVRETKQQENPSKPWIRFVLLTLKFIMELIGGSIIVIVIAEMTEGKSISDLWDELKGELFNGSMWLKILGIIVLISPIVFVFEFIQFILPLFS